MLLQKNVEQARDYNGELSAFGCLLPYPPATSTRMSSRAKQETSEVAAAKKVLTGLHVLVLSTDKHFTEDWQSVLDSLGMT